MLRSKTSRTELGRKFSIVTLLRSTSVTQSGISVSTESSLSTESTRITIVGRDMATLRMSPRGPVTLISTAAGDGGCRRNQSRCTCSTRTSTLEMLRRSIRSSVSRMVTHSTTASVSAVILRRQLRTMIPEKDIGYRPSTSRRTSSTFVGEFQSVEPATFL